MLKHNSHYNSGLIKPQEDKNMFGKKKKAIEIPLIAMETFEKRKFDLVTRRQKIYDQALTHSGNKKFSAYIEACRRHLVAAQEARDMQDLIVAERMSNPTYLLPRKA